MLKSILVLGTGIAIGMCVYKKKQKIVRALVPIAILTH
jgi:hypothetical protein